MRRSGVVVIVVCLMLLVVAIAAWAQEDESGEEPLIVAEPPRAMIDGVWETDLDLRSQAILVPMSLTAEAPADTCSEAPFLIMTRADPAEGSIADVRAATTSVDDPVLSCMWGNPPRPAGFRTVWYQFISPVNGRVTFATRNSSYDTVLAVHRGTCDRLVQLQCNDDANGFTSELTVPVRAGETYYVEIADWQPGILDTTTLRFQGLLLPVDSNWQTVDTNPTTPSITRHATAAFGEYLFVIGGQTGGPGVPQVSNQLLRFNTTTQEWQEMSIIPGLGYSNTTAARLGDRIYVPSGYNGSDVGYDGLHWMYNISADSWSTVASIPQSILPDGLPFAWAASAVPPAENRYFLTGGLTTTEPLDPDANVSRETYAYAPATDSWIQLDPMQAGRYAHSAAWVEASGRNRLGICVAGGLGVEQNDDGSTFTVLHRSAECYQPGGSWQFIGDLQIPRFGAGSAIGPDGQWYIFGGMTIARDVLVPVSQTEVYDPFRNRWILLDPSFDLGSFQGLPPRFFPAGEVIGNHLWVVGGSIRDNGERALPIVEKLFIPRARTFLPINVANFEDYLLPDNTFAQARPIAFGLPQWRNFDRQFDFYDVFYFDLVTERPVTIRLEVPDDANYDVALYGQNKLLWGASRAPFNGDDELITVTLPPRRYFVVVQRLFPTGEPDPGAVYKISVE